MHSDNSSLEEPTPEERAVAAEAVAEQAVARYREMVAASPGLVADMVRGDNIDAIDASAEAARRAYSEISRQVAQSYERNVPTGNPARSDGTLGADALKPEAKIALGLRTMSRRS
jgi:hypothetical protein